MLLSKFSLQDEAGTAGAGGGATGTAPGAAAGGSPAGGVAPWYSSFDAEAQGWIENKGWDKLPADKALPEIVSSFRNTEKYIGVPADQLLRMPKEGDVAAYDQIYTRLGRPADGKSYDLKTPENAIPQFVEWARGTFHKIGLNNAQANALLGSYNEYVGTHTQAEETTYTAKVEQEAGALTKEWGQAHEKNIGTARGAAKELGLSGPDIDALEKSMGYGRLMKMLHGIGAKFGEDKYHAGSGTGTGGDVRSPAAAQAQINTLKQDKDFITKLMNGNVDAKAQWDRLHVQLAGVA